VHMLADHLELYALGELSEDLSAVVASHLKVCAECGTQLEESRAAIGQWVTLADGPDYFGPENRRSPRVEADDPAVLRVLKPERSPRIKMRIVEASKGGLKLRLPRQLMTGTIVQVYVRELFILGEVRYSIPVGAFFHAGVKIQDVFPA
jgi:hypothetical protein